MEVEGAVAGFSLFHNVNCPQASISLAACAMLWQQARSVEFTKNSALPACLLACLPIFWLAWPYVNTAAFACCAIKTPVSQNEECEENRQLVCL